MQSDRVNSITGAAVKCTGMKLAILHPCTGFLCNIPLLRINYLIYLERKTFFQVSPMPLLEWLLAAGMVHLWEERMRKIVVTLLGLILWLAN